MIPVTDCLNFNTYAEQPQHNNFNEDNEIEELNVNGAVLEDRWEELLVERVFRKQRFSPSSLLLLLDFTYY